MSTEDSVARTRPAFNFGDWRIGKVFYTSDWHLGHGRIIELCRRPFASLEEMHRRIIRNTNKAVGSTDTLVIVGDTIMGKFEDTVKLLRQLNAGRIWILPGNHDRFSLAYGHRGAGETQRIKRELWRKEYESARGTRGEIRAEPDLAPSMWHTEVAKQRVAISHYPYVGDSGENDRHRWLRPRDSGLPLICGHVHTRWRNKGPMFNVGVDVNDFAPVPERELELWLRRMQQNTGVVGE